MSNTGDLGKPYISDELNTCGRTELGLAAAHGNLEECQRLIEAGAKPFQVDAYIETPLHLACCFGHLNVAKLLLRDYKVDVDPQNWESWTPLCFAVSRGHFNVMKYLLKSRSDGQWISTYGWQLMHIAAWYNQAPMVAWLTSHGAAASTETIHTHRPFDLTRPGQTRRTLYQAMTDENERAE